MNSKTRELLLEKYEVLSRAADDSNYIVCDHTINGSTLKCKLYTRLHRINSEAQEIENITHQYFNEADELFEEIKANSIGHD